MSAILETAKAAQASADTSKLREAAARLRKSAELASQKLNEIDQQLAHDLKAAARAQSALMVLDGIIKIGNATNKVGTLGLLGSDAPKSPEANMGGDQARSFINNLADTSKASSVELTQQRTSIIRDVSGDVEAFKQESKSTVIPFPPPD
jgi:hypothetical protein